MGSVTVCPLLPPPRLSQVWIPRAQQENPAAQHCLQLLWACHPLSSGQRLSSTLQCFPLKYRRALRWQASKRRAKPASRSQPARCPPAVKGWTEAPRQSSQTCCPLCHPLAGLSFLNSVCSSAQWRESLQPQSQCLSLLVAPRIETRQVHGLWVSLICRGAPQRCTMPLGRAGLRGSPKSLAWALASQAPRTIFNYSNSIRAHLEKRENAPWTLCPNRALPAGFQLSVSC